MPLRIGRHVHPEAAADPDPAPTPTGIDYLRLVEDRHTRSLGERLHYARPAGPAQPVEPLAASRDAGAGQAPPPDRDGLHCSADLLTLAGDHPDGDPASVSASGAVDAAPDAESTSLVAPRQADPTGPTAPPGGDLDPEETR